MKAQCNECGTVTEVQITHEPRFNVLCSRCQVNEHSHDELDLPQTQGIESQIMPRRFTFPNVTSKPRQAVESDPKAFDWSETEIEALSEVSQEDLDDTSDWLKRLGQDDAAALFNAEPE